MGVLSWHEDWNLGIKEIDRQHQKLVDLINYTYHKSRSKDLSQDDLTLMLNDLFIYARYHFKYEEDMLLRNGYENYLEHKDSHNNFFNQLQRFDIGNQKETIDHTKYKVIKYLIVWLVEHILIEDREYSFNLKHKKKIY